MFKLVRSSQRRTIPGRSRTSIYSLSLRCHGKSCRQYILRCVVVAVVLCVASVARPSTIRQAELRQLPAVAAHLAGGFPSTYLHEGASVPFALVSQLPNEFVPATISNRFRETSILEHVLYSKILDCQRLVFTNQLRRHLVQSISPAIGNSLMNQCHTFPTSLPSVRSFLAPVQFFLCSPELLLEAFGDSMVVELPAITESREVGDTEIDSSLFVSWLECSVRLIDPNADEILPCGCPTDRHGRRARSELAGPSNFDFAELRDEQASVLAVPLETGASVFSRLLRSLVLESWIACAALEEVHVCCVEVPECLLKRDTGYIAQPVELFSLFGLRQVRRRVSVGWTFASSFVCRLAERESLIPRNTDATERSSENLLLLGRWVESVFVGLDRHSGVLLGQLSASTAHSPYRELRTDSKLKELVFDAIPFCAWVFKRLERRYFSHDGNWSHDTSFSDNRLLN